jgi:hypothetical protein
MPNTLTKVFELDVHNADISLKALRHYGVCDLLESMPALFEVFLREVEQHLSISIRDQLTRIEPDGSRRPAWDTILRLYMALSAHQQFVFAAGHLLRGHVSEVYGHVRRAVEGAGIAYLTRSEPDIGKIFIDGDHKALRNRTPTGKILPRDNPLTVDLNTTIANASGLVHNNLGSFVNRTQHALSDQGQKGVFKLEMTFYEAHDQQYLLRTAIWLLRAAERVARLLAASIDLPDGIWYRRLELFQADLDALCQRLYDFVQPTRQDEEAQGGAQEEDSGI